MTRGRSIRSSVMLLIISSTAIVALSCLAVWFFIQAQGFRKSIETKTTVIAERLQKTLAVPYWNFDSVQMREILESELGDPDISSIVISDPSLVTFMAKTSNLYEERVGDKADRAVWAKVSRIISYRGTYLGTVTIAAGAKGAIRQFASRIAEQAVLLFLVGAIVAFILFREIDRRISSRIAALRLEIGSFSDKNFQIRATDRGHDEIGQLATTFNTMADIIERYGRDLEGLVEDRLVELRKTQDQLIESAKFAELGRVLAQIIHDLNSPIAAIRATVDRLATEGLPLIEALPAFSSGLGSDDLATVKDAMAFLRGQTEQWDFRKRRDRKSQLNAIISKAGIEDDGRLCDSLIELGIDQNREILDRLLANTGRERLIQVCEAIALMGGAVGTLDAAIERAIFVVTSLRNYLHKEGSDDVKSRFNLAKEIDVILALFAHRLHDGIDLERDVDASLEVSGIRDQLSQVWMNLIDNAIQAVNGTGRISISVRREGQEVIVEIRDSGPGIPEDVKNRLFEPFFTTKPQGQGTGLGLSISKRIVEDHGGRISFTSEPGQTCFRVELPTEEIP